MGDEYLGWGNFLILPGNLLCKFPSNTGRVGSAITKTLTRFAFTSCTVLSVGQHTHCRLLPILFFVSRLPATTHVTFDNHFVFKPTTTKTTFTIT